MCELLALARYVDEDDDCSDMEANYATIEAEEKRR